MTDPATTLGWLPNCAKAFGPLAGAATWARVARLDRAAAPGPAPVRVPGVGTVHLRARARDHAVLQQVWVKRNYDLAARAPEHWPALRAAHEAAERPVVLDAGAHVGMSVLWWKRLFPRATVVALEPHPENFALLGRNTAGVRGVVALNAALAPEPGTARVGGLGAAARVGQDGDAEVPAVTVAELMDRFGARELLLVKLDIEGAEEALFAQDADLDWLDRTRALAVETHDWLFPGRTTSRGLWRAVGARRFDVGWAGDTTLLFRCGDGTGA